MSHYTIYLKFVNDGQRKDFPVPLTRNSANQFILTDKPQTKKAALLLAEFALPYCAEVMLFKGKTLGKLVSHTRNRHYIGR